MSRMMAIVKDSTVHFTSRNPKALVDKRHEVYNPNTPKHAANFIVSKLREGDMQDLVDLGYYPVEYGTKSNATFYKAVEATPVIEASRVFVGYVNQEKSLSNIAEEIKGRISRLYNSKVLEGFVYTYQSTDYHIQSDEEAWTNFTGLSLAAEINALPPGFTDNGWRTADNTFMPVPTNQAMKNLGAAAAAFKYSLRVKSWALKGQLINIVATGNHQDIMDFADTIETGWPQTLADLP